MASRRHPCYLEPGAALILWRNQGWRNAVCLAVKCYRPPGASREDRSADEALVEYVMPGGTSALNIIPADRPDVRKGGRQIPYKRVGKGWLEAIIAAGLEWVGNPQQADGKPPITSVAGMLARYDQRAAERRDHGGAGTGPGTRAGYTVGGIPNGYARGMLVMLSRRRTPLFKMDVESKPRGAVWAQMVIDGYVAVGGKTGDDGYNMPGRCELTLTAKGQQLLVDTGMWRD